jgi:hypothetical protein
MHYHTMIEVITQASLEQSYDQAKHGITLNLVCSAGWKNG